VPDREPQIARHYRPSRFGAVHLRYLAARDAAKYPPLLCLHPAPYSGIYFTTVMPLLNADRAIIAPDYPGYGGSAPTQSSPSVGDYASAMLDVLDDMSIESVDVLGFHTGCLVGCEMSLRDSATVRRLVLIDVPFFTGDERADLHARTTVARALDTDPDGLASEWDRNVTQRLDSMPFARAYELFVESLRSGTRSHWGFHAAFSYPSDQRLPNVTAPTRVIATRSALLEATRQAATVLPQATLVERLDIERAVFEEGANRIAVAIDAALR